MHAIFRPVLIKEQFEGKRVINAACGEEFSLILTENLKDSV